MLALALIFGSGLALGIWMSLPEPSPVAARLAPPPLAGEPPLAPPPSFTVVSPPPEPEEETAVVPIPSEPSAVPEERSAEEELIDFTRAWARAWAEKRIDDYLAFYADDFRPRDGLSREEWRVLRRTRLAQPRVIALELSEIVAVPLSAERAQVRFFQTYQSNLYGDRVGKTLALVRRDGAWRILEERVDD